MKNVARLQRISPVVASIVFSPNSTTYVLSANTHKELWEMLSYINEYQKSTCIRKISLIVIYIKW